MSRPSPLIPTPEDGVYEFECDNTTLEVFVACKRSAQLYKMLRRESAREKSALFFGQVIHAALEPRKLGDPNHFGAGVKIIEDSFAANIPSVDEWRTADRAIRTLIEYNKTYPLEQEPFSIVPGTVEKAFRIFVGECEVDAFLTDGNGSHYVKSLRLYWTGRIDAVIDEGSLFVFDHKTTSIFGEQFLEDFELAQQMLGYTWAARQPVEVGGLGLPVVGLRLDAIINRKPSKTGKEIELHRMPYWYDEFHINEWREDIYSLITDFIENWIRGYFPKGTKWCHGKFGKCQYWEVCKKTSQEARDEELASDDYKDVVWSPLHERVVPSSTLPIPDPSDV